MSYETEEQQLEQLKAWWSDNGTPLIVGAVLGLAGFAGWKYWNQKQIDYQAGASDLYVKVSQILESENKTGLAESAEAVKTQYPDSSYAIMAAFHLAKIAVDAGDFDKAVAELNWVLEKHSGNVLAEVAKLRLARIYIQQDKAVDALALVDVDSESGYYSLANLIKGDALVALKRNEEALQAYKIASADLEMVAKHPTLQIKIESLSGQSSGKIISATKPAGEAANAEEKTEAPKTETPKTETEQTSEPKTDSGEEETH